MHTKTIILILFSALPTILVWRQIARGKAQRTAKLFWMLFAVVPVFGPVFYLMINAPAPLPREQQQVNMSNRGTEVHGSFQPLAEFIRQCFSAK